MNLTDLLISFFFILFIAAATLAAMHWFGFSTLAAMFIGPMAGYILGMLTIWVLGKVV